jgi:hypothetical protein
VPCADQARKLDAKFARLVTPVLGDQAGSLRSRILTLPSRPAKELWISADDNGRAI